MVKLISYINEAGIPSAITVEMANGDVAIYHNGHCVQYLFHLGGEDRYRSHLYHTNGSVQNDRVEAVSSYIGRGWKGCVHKQFNIVQQYFSPFPEPMLAAVNSYNIRNPEDHKGDDVIEPPEVDDSLCECHVCHGTYPADYMLEVDGYAMCRNCTNKNPAIK